MKKIISLMLSLIIILSLVCVAAPTVSAASAMKTSDMGINMIKSFEGFRKWPEMDNGQWTVGYGTGVSGADLEKYRSNGITQDEATKLLAEHLGTFEDSVNEFIDDHKLTLSQHQFDALVSFTYNLGPSWMQSSGTFRTAVINGKTGNDLIYAIAQFGKAGGVVVGGLVERRLCEANLYLNGAYSTEPPANFKYVIYNGNMEGAAPTVTIQGYDTTKAAAVKSTVTMSGYRFMGWYTKPEGGNWVTSLSASSAISNNTLYAHWQEGDGPVNSDGSIKGTGATYSGYAPAGEQKICKVPNGTKVGTTKVDEKLTVTAEYVDSKGVKWGKIGTDKWIDVTKGLAATPTYENSSSAISPVTVTVTTNNVNNRIGPGTNYGKQGTYALGEQLVITAVQKGGNYTWGKSERGWIALNYTDYATSSVVNSADAKKVTGIGTVIKADVVNVRVGAGTKHAKSGYYCRGDEIKITLRQKVGGTTWGLTEKGWISLYYVNVKDVTAGSVPDIEVSTGVAGGTTNGTVSNGSTTVISTGVVYNCNTLRIRLNAGTSNPKVGEYASGTYVNILETTTVKSEVWGRTEEGWISLRYVKLDAPTTGMGVTGRVVKCTTLNVRSGAGTHYPKTGKLAKGTKVEIVDYTKVGNATWGLTSQGGWISLHYVALDTPLENLGQNNGATGGIGGSTGNGSTGSESAPTEPAPTQPQGKQYTIKIGTIKNGSIEASGETAGKGDKVSLTIAPKAGYELEKLTVKNASGQVISVTDNEFTMPASNVTVEATFKTAAKKHSITINSASNGKVTASVTTSAAGEEILLTAAPNSGYELDTLTAMNTTNNTQVTVTNGKFTMPDGNVNIVATFKKASADTYKVSFSSITNGSVTANVTSAKAGDTVTLTIAPADGYALDALTIKDASNGTVTAAGSGNTRTFTMPAGNVTITAYFAAVKYNVAIATSTNGSVSVNPDTYKKGETVSLTVTPTNGYVLDKLTVKDASGAIITATGNAFTMPASDVTVSATFKKNAFTVEVTTNDRGTAKASSGTAKMGDTITITCTPLANYEMNDVYVKDAEGNSIAVSGTGTTRAFTMPASNVTVSVYFQIIKRDIEITTPVNGTVTANPTASAKNKTVTLTVKPDAGYELDKLTVKDASGKAITVKDNKFTMPESKVTVTATFKKLSYTITTGTTDKGKVTGAPKTAGVGDTITLTVTPDAGYMLDMLIVKDASKKDLTVSGTGNTRTFTMPASKVTIDATFKLAPVYFDVTVDSAIANGTVTADKASAEENETVTLTANPAEGYELDQITVNGKAITGNTFKMPKENAVVSATFKAVRTITITVRDAEGDRVQGVSVALYNQAGGFAEVVAAKVSNSNGVITFTTSELAGITNGMKLVAEVQGSYTYADAHPVRDAVGSIGLVKGEDGNSNDWLEVTAANGAPISGTFTVRVKPAT